MSLLGMSYLNEIAGTSKDLCASNMLDELRERVIRALHQTGQRDEARDGMEMSLCVLEPGKQQMQYAGAYRPLYLVRDGQLMETRGDCMPIGIHDEDTSFTCHQVKLQDKDMIYLFSDGFVDQIGGPHKKTFRTRHFRKLLSSVAHKNMQEQEQDLERSLDEWKGSYEQIDDILVLGFRIANS
jgi:serine phosphatase RsbU (regulator of sigma subunit)